VERTSTTRARPPSGWRCPRCKRRFTRPNQRHACGTGDRSEVLRDRPPALVEIYRAIETFVKKLGPIEIVARDRYVLLRSVRIFTDLVIMTDAVRVAIHLGRRVRSPQFIKIAADRRHITHVAKLQTKQQFETIAPLIREAYEFSLSRPSSKAE
jgi:predicted transport protein